MDEHEVSQHSPLTLHEMLADSGASRELLATQLLEMRALNSALARTVGDLIAVLSRCTTCRAGLAHRSEGRHAAVAPIHGGRAVDESGALNAEAVRLLKETRAEMRRSRRLISESRALTSDSPAFRHEVAKVIERPDDVTID